MKRRHFLTMSGALLAAPSLVSLARAQAPTRAAVVIGIDKTGGLPKLNAAASGADGVATWLRGEGFAVTLLTDAEKPVLASAVFDAIKEFLDAPTVEQLVVYFSGHGFLSGPTSEYWLLSHAPENANEAISVLGSIQQARISGLDTVAFISDACRSRPDTFAAGNITGYNIFPSRPATGKTADVDRFYATTPGDPALELKISEAVSGFEGLYTSCFLDAFKSPYRDMVVPLPSGISVVPNRKLKTYLPREMKVRLAARNRTLRQNPDSEINSADEVYIGRVASAANIRPVTEANSAPVVGIKEVAKEQLAWAGLEMVRIRPGAAEFKRVSDFSGFDKALFSVRDQTPPRVSVTGTGPRTACSIQGARVLEAKATVGLAEVRPLSAFGDTTAIIHVQLPANAKASSLAVRFTDGTGTVVAILDEFTAEVSVDEGRVVNVSYVPSIGTSKWERYQSQHERVALLRSAVATSARYGVFRFDGTKEEKQRQAEELAGRVRLAKDIDPTLGIYAAYAYSDAGLIESVRSVRDFMLSDLQTELFDVLMLTGMLNDQTVPLVGPIVPFCPMLSQGFALLKPYNIRLSEPIAAAQRYLRPALWTTFEAEGMSMILRALQRH